MTMAPKVTLPTTDSADVAKGKRRGGEISLVDIKGVGNPEVPGFDGAVGLGSAIGGRWCLLSNFTT